MERSRQIALEVFSGSENSKFDLFLVSVERRYTGKSSFAPELEFRHFNNSGEVNTQQLNFFYADVTLALLKKSKNAGKASCIVHGSDLNGNDFIARLDVYDELIHCSIHVCFIKDENKRAKYDPIFSVCLSRKLEKDPAAWLESVLMTFFKIAEDEREAKEG